MSLCISDRLFFLVLFFCFVCCYFIFFFSRFYCFYMFIFVYCYYFVFFFFSSRRRHTRFDCDWSSDVCSSDLSPFFRSLPLAEHGLQWIDPPLAAAHPFDDGTAAILARSIDETAADLGADGTEIGRASCRERG